jgi:hypothetical protein
MGRITPGSLWRPYVPRRSAGWPGTRQPAECLHRHGRRVLQQCLAFLYRRHLSDDTLEVQRQDTRRADPTVVDSLQNHERWWKRFFMLYCVNDSQARLQQAMAADGLLEMPYDFDYEGAKVLVNF